MNKKRVLKIAVPVLVVVLFLVALFFNFRLSGYGVMAMIFFGAAALICAFVGLRVLGRRHERAARIIRRSLIAVLCAGFLYFSVVEIIIVRNSRTDEGSAADYLIVLGAGVDGKNPSLILWDRLQATLSYLNQHTGTKAVVSGAQGEHEEISEADCMYKWLTDNGISPNRIIREERARSTAQNIAYSLEIIRSDTQKQNPSIAIITSEFHLYRAKLIAEKNGIANPICIAASTSLPVIKINYYIREAFAVSALWAFGR